MKNKNLPKGWHWSYILRPHLESNGKKGGWSACAVKYAGKSKEEDGRELGLYHEVFTEQKTMKEAIRAIQIKIIAKRHKTRWINFPVED